ncbi:MAG: hypothetical protein R3D02_09950 [Hyphomicrobiales bacterium]
MTTAEKSGPSRRNVLGGAIAGIGAATLAAPAIASGAIEWRMVTSWPKNLPGPGVSAERLAARLETLSGGRLKVRVFAAGELVPALECSMPLPRARPKSRTPHRSSGRARCRRRRFSQPCRSA